MVVRTVDAGASRGGCRRLLLRRLSIRDAPGYEALTGMPAMLKSLSADARRPRHQVARAVGTASGRNWRAQGVGSWVATTFMDRRRVVGAIGLAWIPILQRHELSFCLDPALAGRGFGSACVAAVLMHAKAATAPGRIFALVQPDNVKAQRVLARNGFSIGGLMRQAGRPVIYFRQT